MSYSSSFGCVRALGFFCCSLIRAFVCDCSAACYNNNEIVPSNVVRWLCDYCDMQASMNANSSALRPTPNQGSSRFTLCSACSLGSSNVCMHAHSFCAVLCAVCNLSGGAMKASKLGECWTHICCVIYSGALSKGFHP
jgi:hypothetical protein